MVALTFVVGYQARNRVPDVATARAEPMTNHPGVTRRRFLYGSAAGASAVPLAGCMGDSDEQAASNEQAGGTGDRQGSSTDPLAPPAQFNEAPMLAEQVEAGELPPVTDRLPAQPYVVPHRWVTTGNYGGQLLMSTDDSTATLLKEYSYGHSFLRFLNDGLDIGPGLAHSWESNDDGSQWTFHFREGLKWSDGQPWTTADIMYWWEDLVQHPDHTQGPPDDVRSGRDTLAELSAPDDHTLVLTFDAPAPVTPEKVAAWVNRVEVGPWWHLPKHYLQQFHPDYNDDVTSDTWFQEHDQRADSVINADCPTMAGWRTTTYDEGSSVVMERNPYCWEVDTEGNQLPYIDRLNWNVVQDSEVQRLQFTEGRIDYVHGRHTALVLDDVSALQEAADRTGVGVRFWDSGSGTGSILFFNQDFPGEKMRELIRDRRFRRALSFGFNREDTRKAIYYDTGELTTGTLSPKGLIFKINDEAEQRYVEWRDAYVAHDPERAMELLDELGVVDSNGDGMREMPDGSELEVSLDFPADASDEHVRKNNHLVRDWEAIGIKAQPSPVPPEAWTDTWARGELMTTTAWEVGDNHPLIYPGWVIPVEPGHWAPLHGQAYQLQTEDPQQLEEEADVSPWDRQPPWMLPENDDDPVARLWDLYARARVEHDEMTRIGLLWDIVKIHIEEGPFFIGSVADYPAIVLVRDGLSNVPNRENLALGGWVNPWILPSPAVYDPETYFWDNPEEHS